jgi:hypothetical protein
VLEGAGISDSNMCAAARVEQMDEG